MSVTECCSNQDSHHQLAGGVHACGAVWARPPRPPTPVQDGHDERQRGRVDGVDKGGVQQCVQAGTGGGVGVGNGCQQRRHQLRHLRVADDRTHLRAGQGGRGGLGWVGAVGGGGGLGGRGCRAESGLCRHNRAALAAALQAGARRQVEGAAGGHQTVVVVVVRGCPQQHPAWGCIGLLQL